MRYRWKAYGLGHPEKYVKQELGRVARKEPLQQTGRIGRLVDTKPRYYYNKIIMAMII